MAILVGVLGAAVFTAISLAATTSARLSLGSRSPVTVSGSGFKAHEHVKLTVSATTTRSKLLVTGTRGGFRTTFKAFAIGRCDAYVVTAKGNRGSSAVVRVTPDCAPARAPAATTTTDALLPQDPGAPKKPH